MNPISNTMKIERNAPCPCGSGLKYKKCCAGKESITDTTINMSNDSLLSIIKFGLENGNVFADGAKKVNVKAVSTINGGDTILVEFYAQHSKALDIKWEMAYIMSFLSSFLKDELYNDTHIKMFGVKAYNQNDVEIMYAINTKAGAAAIANGNSIEWFKTTLFQENTADYRLARAKTMISDIENALRKVIKDLYESKLGAGWWDAVIESKVSSVIKGIYKNQFGSEISDGSILINYTFTLDLKKIVSADWGTFRHLFDKKIAFEQAMVDLNVIRREEAHNRDITEAHLADLERIYYTLLGEIASLYPDVTVNYMVENWRSKIKSAMSTPIGCIYTMDEFNEKDLEGRRQLIITDCNAQIVYLGNIVRKLNSLSPPVSKRKKHEEMISLLNGMLSLQEQKLQRTQDLQFDDVQEIINAIQQQKMKMDIFSYEFVLQES
jgi:hypothetical protein